jgi:hypothetical protein
LIDMVGDRKGNDLEKFVFTRLDRSIRDYLNALKVAAVGKTLADDSNIYQRTVAGEFLCFSSGLFRNKLHTYLY